jgi:hypothetical protein
LLIAAQLIRESRKSAAERTRCDTDHAPRTAQSSGAIDAPMDGTMAQPPAKRRLFKPPMRIECARTAGRRNHFLGYGADLSETGVFIQSLAPRPPEIRFPPGRYEVRISCADGGTLCHAAFRRGPHLDGLSLDLVQQFLVVDRLTQNRPQRLAIGTGYEIPVRTIERYDAVFDEHAMPKPVVPRNDAGPWVLALRELLTVPDAYWREARLSRTAAERFVNGLDAGALERLLRSLAAGQAGARKPPEEHATIESLSPEKRALLLERLRKRKMTWGGGSV